MPVLEFSCEIPAPLERVWAWHEDVASALKVLSPPDVDVRIESIDLPPRVGTEVRMTARALGNRRTWVARYVTYVPPHPVAFGVEARFVDEQVSGPFQFWRHEHEFEAIDSKTTRLLDRVTYRPPLWPVSLPADWLLIRPRLRALFAFRHRALIAAFA